MPVCTRGSDRLVANISVVRKKPWTIADKLQQIHHQPHQQVFLLGITCGDQQGQGHQAIVVEAGLIEEIVLPEKEHEEKGPDPLVAIAERVVFDHEVEQMGGLLLCTGVKILAAEGLIEVAENALEMLAQLLAEEFVGLAPAQQFGPEG